MVTDIHTNATAIYDRILSSLAQAGRTDHVTFAAVSKTRTVDEMHAAENISCIDCFGENRVQEAESC